MMSTETSPGEEDLYPGLRRRASPGRAPVEFVYEGGEIMLELLRGRDAEEERRRFVAALGSDAIRSLPRLTAARYCGSNSRSPNGSFVLRLSSRMNPLLFLTQEPLFCDHKQ
jgi:hypothetical protein